MISSPLKFKKKHADLGRGFTLIELVVVIVLLAIVGLYASSKFLGRSQFYAAGAQEQVISIVRHVQISAMQNNADRVLTLESDQFGVSQECDNIAVSSAVLCDLSKTNNQHQLSALTLTYDFPGASGAVSSLSFDLFGKPIQNGGIPLCTSGNCRITLSETDSSAQRSVCINSEGYIFRSIQYGVCP